MHGLNWQDYGARWLDNVRLQWTSVDPLAEKYYSISPYAYCAGNPVNRIDINGDSISAEQQESQQMITNTLTTEDAKYVQFNEDGDINMDLLTSHSSDSENYNNLVTEATSDLWTLVSSSDTYTYTDNYGNLQGGNMSYDKFNTENYTPDGNSINNTTTGESGKLGIAILPGTGESGVNSSDGNIHIIINKNLSPQAQAESYSHEENGHGLMYIKTRDRNQSKHIGVEGKETNIMLKNMIIKSKMETVKNMKTR